MRITSTTGRADFVSTPQAVSSQSDADIGEADVGNTVPSRQDESIVDETASAKNVIPDHDPCHPCVSKWS